MVAADHGHRDGADDRASPAFVGIAMVLAMNVGHDMMYGPMAARLSDLFGTHMRYSDISFVYQLGSVFLALTLCLARVAAAQSPADSAKQHDSGPTRAWFSLGVGGGNSNRGGIAGRAAASVAVNRVLVFTLEGTSVGSIDGSDDSINLMAGVRSPDPDGFAFLSAGLANTSCGSGCANQTGVAIDGGYHFGGRYAGVGIAGFAVRAPARSSTSGIVVAIDVGWFGHQRAVSSQAK